MKKILYPFFIVFLFFVFYSCSKEENEIFDSIQFPEEVHFDKFTEKQTFRIQNSSEKSLMMNIIFDDFITHALGKEQLQILEAHSTFEIDLDFKRNLIREEFYSGFIHIYLPAINKEVSIPVHAETVLPKHVNLGNLHLLDAEYLPEEDKILTISEYPDNELRFIDPHTGTYENILLNKAPGYFHVNHEAGKVVISQLHEFSIFDLKTKTIENTPINIGPYPIILPTESFLIAMRDNGVDFGLSLINDSITFEHYTFVAQMEMHPHNSNRILASGESRHKFKLAAMNFTSGDLLIDYLTTEGDPEKDFQGKFFLTQNKNWIFAENLDVYTCNPDKTLDLRYQFALEEGVKLNSICYLEKFDKFIAIHRYRHFHSDQNYAVIYNATDFSIEGKFPVPAFEAEMEKESPETADGKYIFTNKDESKIYVLILMGTERVELGKWEILIYDTNQLFN